MVLNPNGNGFEIVTNDNVEIKCEWSQDAAKQITSVK